MELYNLILFTHNKYDYFKYVIIGIIVISLVNNLDKILTYRLIMSLIIAGVVIYVLIKYNSQKVLTDYKFYRRKLKTLNYDNMIWIQSDLEILPVLPLN